METGSTFYYVTLLVLGIATGALIAWIRRGNDDT